MSWTKSIYWLTRLDNISGFFTSMSVLFGISLLVIFAYRLFMFIEGEEPTKKPIMVGILTFLFFFFIILRVLTPTTKEAIIIVSAGKTLDYVSTDTSIRKIPGKVVDVTNEWLDKKLKEMKGDLEGSLDSAKIK